MTPSRHTQAQALQSRAEWHRREAQNFLRHSCAAMYQHEKEAIRLEREAIKLLNQPKG